MKVESKEFVSSDEFWWPEQKAPNKLISCTVDHNNNRERILVESLAGIAAKAVNEGKNDEMVWITVGTTAAKEWFNRTLDRLAITEIQVMNVWELLNHMTNKGLVAGYVVYDYDDGDGKVYTKRNDMNNSANVATSVASIINAAVVDRSLESKMLDANLLNLFDASSNVSYSEVYQHLTKCNKSQFNYDCRPKSTSP